MEFSICRGEGGGSGGINFYMFSAYHQNAFKVKQVEAASININNSCEFPIGYCHKGSLQKQD